MSGVWALGGCSEHVTNDVAGPLVLVVPDWWPVVGVEPPVPHELGVCATKRCGRQLVAMRRRRVLMQAAATAAAATAAASAAQAMRHAQSGVGGVPPLQFPPATAAKISHPASASALKASAAAALAALPDGRLRLLWRRTQTTARPQASQPQSPLRTATSPPPLPSQRPMFTHARRTCRRAALCHSP